ncbi:hypothetical protein HAX54_014694 [Datura stramonium]|uniref:Uncharacterized protein n=1 Tax=Datura stramonium TaxID=4076 RepID=A0ABS8TQC9_DATST|nr:hypothetical protein [Datura stramonium]
MEGFVKVLVSLFGRDDLGFPVKCSDQFLLWHGRRVVNVKRCSLGCWNQQLAEARPCFLALNGALKEVEKCKSSPYRFSLNNYSQVGAIMFITIHAMVWTDGSFDDNSESDTFCCVSFNIPWLVLWQKAYQVCATHPMREIKLVESYGEEVWIGFIFASQFLLVYMWLVLKNNRLVGRMMKEIIGWSTK